MSYSSLAQAMINYVECHLESFDMTQMSETFGFSESYLRELFSKHVNMPIMQYYRKRRITVSAFEILHSGKKIVDIAFETGFSNHESYTRAFRKVFGMSPNRYRTDRPPMGREQLGEKIDSARQEDTGAYEQIKRILQNPIPFLK